jgi:hypothetical protein
MLGGNIGFGINGSREGLTCRGENSFWTRALWENAYYGNSCGGAEGGGGGDVAVAMPTSRELLSFHFTPAQLSHPSTHGLISSSASHHTAPLLCSSCSAIPAAPNSSRNAVVTGQQPSRFIMQYALCRSTRVGHEDRDLMAHDADTGLHACAAWKECDWKA